MLGVMLLEVVGSVAMIVHFFKNKALPVSLIKVISKLLSYFDCGYYALSPSLG